jgi:hypothetical protein
LPSSRWWRCCGRRSTRRPPPPPAQSPAELAAPDPAPSTAHTHALFDCPPSPFVACLPSVNCTW